MALSYYGDKISDNMEVTPEGYLICKNTPIGRTGSMMYYGQELPSVYNEPFGKICEVRRTPEELFSDNTIASFEGKSITNLHPTSNLDVNTTSSLERGHMQNVRKDGSYLVADLFIKDAGLISEIQNNIKREVSCGYDCFWDKVGDGKYEQKNIIGNHLAVVPNGRAGSKVSIHDSKKQEGKKIMTKNISKKFLTALGFKHFSESAEPEEIASAMDALNEEDKKEEPKEEQKKEEAKKESAKDDDQEKENSQFKELMDKIKALEDKIKTLEAPKKETNDSETVLNDLEKEVSGEKQSKDDGEGLMELDKKLDKSKDEDTVKEDGKSKKAGDSALKKFVQDMKPIIMAIPDEKARLEAAKKFVSVVHDSRPTSNGYADILNTAMEHKQSAMDSSQKLSLEQAAIKSCDAWKKAGETMRNNK